LRVRAIGEDAVLAVETLGRLLESTSDGGTELIEAK
jgi:hypothetical protein